MGVKQLCATSISDLRKLAHLRKSGGEGSSVCRLRNFKYQPAQTCALAQMDGDSGSAGLRKSSLLALAGGFPLGEPPAQLAQTCAPHRPGVGNRSCGTAAGRAGLERESGPQQSGERAPVRGVRVVGLPPGVGTVPASKGVRAGTLAVGRQSDTRKTWVNGVNAVNGEVDAVNGHGGRHG